ncbi:nucleotidyltransferase family protein [Neobacillus sp. OS1-33]|uniref:nucleotidyltransferase domain-containing protein n=1 Tax=Neobacillus sp. OS1-33 TaxID=3070683 RepID=UPI0027DF81B4|nr:nucleotidyltransferase family protein [Neobacillus sp. OS1-33]WML25172.1 nucleotidyltransferase family protein [Neobacillus sp. OS1-33]
MDNNLCLDVTGLPKELIFLLEVLKSDHGSMHLDGENAVTEINWNLFLELAMHHRIYPLIYPKLKMLDKKRIPENVINFLGQQYKQNTFHMLQLSAEMGKISQLFSDNKMRLLNLKGPVLATDLYGELSLRTCGDLDILVPIQDLERVDLLLLNQGYIKDDYIQTILGDWKWRHHHVTYFHSEKQIKIEIHWRLNPGPGKEPCFDELWERKRVSSLTNYPVYYLGREDLFLFLVSHGARHGWSRLRWLTDINEILKQDIDWVELVKMLKKYHYLQIGGQALILASQLLNSKLSEDSRPLIIRKEPKKLAQEAIFYFNRMINLHSFPIPEDVAVYHKHHLFSLMSIKQKFFFILSFLYPYPEDAEILPLPKQVHFLYFPLRPFLWIWKKLKRQVLRRRIS